MECYESIKDHIDLGFIWLKHMKDLFEYDTQKCFEMCDNLTQVLNEKEKELYDQSYSSEEIVNNEEVKSIALELQFAYRTLIRTFIVQIEGILYILR